MSRNSRIGSLPDLLRALCTLLASMLAVALTMGTTAAARAASLAPRDLMEFRIDGNSVLPQGVIEAAVYPFLGPARDPDDAERARAALEAAYQQAGYLGVVVELPAPAASGVNATDEPGVVVLKVIENPVERLRVAGARYHLPSRLRAGLPSLAPGSVPNFNDVQEELGELARSPDLRVSPLLRRGRAPGTIEIELAVEDSLPLHGSAELNSRRSPDTVYGRLEAALRYENLWQRRHALGLNYFVAPNARDQAEIVGLSYSLPWAANTLAFYAVHSNSNVPTAFDTRVVGKGTTWGARWVHPFGARAGWYHSATLGADYKDFAQDVDLAGLSFAQPLRYLPLMAQYNALRLDERGSLSLQLAAVWGVRGLLEREVDCLGAKLDQFACRRAGAQPNFYYWRGELEGRRRLGAGFEAALRLDFQNAGQPLVSNEQLIAGGLDSVRGYLEGEQAGDSGWRARVELYGPGIGFAEDWLAARALVFYDAAWLQLLEPLPGQREAQTLAAYGLGLRLTGGSGFALDLDIARSGHASSRTADGERRAAFRLSYRF